MLTVILAGGSSRRMGRDKALLPYGETTLLQTLIDRYAVFGPVLVSVDRAGRFQFHGASECQDAYPGQGPLNGILSGFRDSDADELLLTAVDLPYGDPSLALRLSALRGDADACVLRFGPKETEPLFAVYGRRCYHAAEETLAAGRRSIKAMMELIKIRYVLPEELTEFDLDRIFTNVNTPDEYLRLK